MALPPHSPEISRDGGPAEVFRNLVPAILARYLRQNSRPILPKAELMTIGGLLWEIVAERGLPPPLGPDEAGAPGELPEAECTALVSRALHGLEAPARDDLVVPVRHLVKACFNPEFKNCRNSYREKSSDGSCRRQELARTRKRTSGAHCVDCPHWVALAPGEHLEFLARAWAPEGLAEFAAHLDIFLPEDFRAFRRLVRARARAPL
jgi:hypothetical protein